MKSLLIIACFTVVSAFFVHKNEELGGLGRVSKIEGKEVYLYSEPQQEYKIVEDYNNSKNVIASCTLENIVTSHIKRGKKDKVNFDALLMDTQDNIYLIKFVKEAAPKE
jgi:hypothetical protein